MAHITLVDMNGTTLWTAAVAPAGPNWPTTRWAANERWRGQHLWRLPASLPGGLHQWQIQLCPTRSPCAATIASLGQLQVDEPNRLYTSPPAALALDHSFGSLARLAGISTELNEAEGMLTVTLLWQALAETETSYRVFIHLLDGNGTLLNQSDGEPAGWQRPTTGWLPGEFISDEHQISWPGEIGRGVQLAIGIYDSSSGSRLPVDDGVSGDRLLIPLPR